MLKFGFEREYFVTDEEGNAALAPKSVPHDGGILVEARGEPSSNPIDAAFNLLAEEYKIQNMIPENLHLNLDVDILEVPPELRLQARREYTKDLIHYQNLGGHERHNVKPEEMTAGVHVSVTRSTSVHASAKCPSCAERVSTSTDVNQMFDFAQFVRAMDEEFKDEIEQASRLPGFYEIKKDGRVEYRSLPMSVDILRVAEFVKKSVSKIHGSW